MQYSIAMAAIEVDSISKTYARTPLTVPAVSQLSFTAEQGQALALMGPNGAGKSTVVRILSTLSRPDSGRASIVGFDVVKEAAAVRAAIGVALQQPGIYPNGKVHQVLLHHARLYGLSRADAARRRDEIIEIVGLTRVTRYRVRHLSGGTRRRLDLGLALLSRPPVLLLDEPTDSIDPFSSREFWRELSRLRDEGVCILFASQNLDEVEQLADRVLILTDGAVSRDDVPASAVREVWMSSTAVGERSP